MPDNSQPIALSYNAALHRVRIAMKRRVAMDSPEPPKDLFQRAKAKLESEKKKGVLADYVIHSRNFSALWQRLASREMPAVGPDSEIVLTLGAGTPTLKGVEISESIDDSVLCDLSIMATPDEIKTWRFTWLQVMVEAWLAKHGKVGSLDRAQLRAMMARALRKEKVLEESLKPGPTIQLQKQYPGKPYTMVARESRREHVLLIFDFESLAKPGEIKNLLAKLKAYGQKLEAEVKFKYRFYDTEVQADLEHCIAGQERFGIGMPYQILTFFKTNEAIAGAPAAVAAPAAGTAPTTATASASAVGAKKPGAAPSGATVASLSPGAPIKHDFTVPDTYPGKGMLELEVSADKMMAQVRRFKMSHYSDKAFTPNEEWLRTELKRLKVVAAGEKVMQRVLLNLGRSRDINGLAVAQGEVGSPGAAPKIVIVKQDEAPGDSKDVDVRSRQITVVKAGQMVAKIVYDILGTNGIDVYGTQVPPPPGEKPNITLGEGVEEKGHGEYFAKRDGLVVLEKGTLDVSLTYIHYGNVNLSSGDIRFEGKVVIDGSVEAGALVVTTGDLMITKDLRGARVVCGGSLKVEGGVVTGDKGSVRVRGSIKAGFIENSSVWCDKDLVVSKAILNSRVNCNGNVTVVGETSRISGGELSVRGIVRAGNIGFASGGVTRIGLGRDWRLFQRVKIRRGRIVKLKSVLETDKKELRELARRRKEQLTSKYEEMKDKLLSRIERLRGIEAKLNDLLSQAERTQTFNAESCVFATESLYPSAVFEIGDITISTPQAIGGVGVSASRIGTSHFVPHLDLEKLVRAREPKAAEVVDKKAS